MFGFGKGKNKDAETLLKLMKQQDPDCQTHPAVAEKMVDRLDNLLEKMEEGKNRGLTPAQVLKEQGIDISSRY